jgi:dihydroorotate dehydrogenase electron transfer subunit
MILEKAPVFGNDDLGAGYYRISMGCHSAYGAAHPGQFVMLKIGDSLDPLLRRPFSIHHLSRDEKGEWVLDVLYKVVGKGTDMLSRYEKGEYIDLFGPLGKGFTIPEGDSSIMMVAGGIGIAPMIFLAEVLEKKGVDLSVASIFIGGCTRADLLCLDRFSRSGMTVTVTTEDGGAGEKGLVTAPVEKALKKHAPNIIYTCGPPGMLAAVAALSVKYRIPCQLSVETIMACGMGACLGCAVGLDEKSGKYLHACMDGPVFEAGQLMPFLF